MDPARRRAATAGEAGAEVVRQEEALLGAGLAAGVAMPHSVGSAFEAPLERNLSSEMALVSVQRLCIVEEDRAGLLAEVTTRIGSWGLNIVGNTCKARGHLVFQVVDIEVAHDQTAMVLAEVERIPGVRSVSLGAFNSTTGKIYKETAPLRLCVVNDNVPGVLGQIASLLEVDLGIKILAQVNRSRGDRAFNVFDVKNSEQNWANICIRVEALDHVLSCTMGSFKAGGLAETIMTSRDDDRLSDATDDGLSVKSTTPIFSPSASAAPTIVEEETSSLPARDEEGESPSPNVFVPPPPRPASSASVMARVKSASGLPVRPAFSGSVGASPIGGSSASVGGGGGGTYYSGSRETTRSRTLMIMNERGALTKDASKLVIVMVGLPARGKSFTARKLKRFLCWRNSLARIFNAGKYRRERRNSAESTGNDNANFFEDSNEEGNRVRREAANRALNDLLHFLSKSKQTAVGIFDATNSTKERRRWIVDQAKGIASVCFIEVICDDEEVLLENLMSKVRNSPDFEGMDESKALGDLRARISAYEKVYEPVDEDVSYIKIYNMSSKMLANKIYGRLARSILPYMLSLHVGLRPIYFVRAGLAEDSRISSMKHWPAEFDFLDPSTESKASGLSQLGHDFAERLARWLQTAVWVRDDDDVDDAESFVEEQAGEGAHASPLGSAFASMPNIVDVDADGLSSRIFHSERRREVRKADGTRQRGAVIKLLSSTLPRATQTADIAKSLLDGSTVVELCPMLNPLNKGELGGLSMDAIQKLNPDFYESWRRHPYTHRFPGGESYLDLVTRLEPVLIEVEQQTAPCLIVSHVSCIQVLLAYFLGAPVEEAMKIKVPLHKLIEVTPTLGGSWEMKEYEI